MLKNVVWWEQKKKDDNGHHDFVCVLSVYSVAADSISKDCWGGGRPTVLLEDLEWNIC